MLLKLVFGANPFAHNVKFSEKLNLIMTNSVPNIMQDAELIK